MPADPRWIARSMLSFGIEYDRAFATAAARVLLAAGSGPPSFAATMIARESFENSWPRFLSVAAFLCLIVDHLEWPDMEPPLSPAPVARRRARPPRPTRGSVGAGGRRRRAPGGTRRP